MFKKITTQTKRQGKVFDFLNKLYDNYCKNAKKMLSSFNPLCFLKTQISFTIFSISNQKKGKKEGFSKFPNKTNLLGSKINSQWNLGNNDFYFFLALHSPWQQNEIPDLISNEKNKTITFEKSLTNLI